MKKFINILLAAAVTALAVVSCQKEEQIKPGTPDPEGCYGVYFPVQEATGSHTYDPDMDRSVTFTVARTNTNGAITVPYTVVSENKEVFKFEDIEFADGQAETELEVTFDDIEEGKTCSFSIQLNDDNAYVSHYNTGAIALDFSVIVVKWQDFLDPKTNEPAVFTINSRWNATFGPMKATLKYYEVDGIRTGVFTSIDKNADSGELEGFWHSLPEVTLNIRWYTKNQNSAGYDFVELPKQYFGYDYNGGDWLKVPVGEAAAPIYVYDYPWYWVERGYDWGADGMGDNWLDEANKTGQMDGSYPVSYYDGNGGFFFNIYFYIPGTGGWKPDDYGTVAIASGFTRVDYSLEVDSDFPSEGVTPIMFTVGADVAKVDYAIYEGSLNSVQIQARVDAIAAGEEENVLTVNEFTFDEDTESYYALVGVSPETTGEYTLVAVSFNKITEEITESVAQNAQSLSFNHISADSEEEHAVRLKVGTEDVPARYGDYPTTSSFAYYVVGKDIKVAHIGIYDTESFEKAKDEILAAVKKGEDKSVSNASASVLAEINGAGGFYTYVTELKALTSYTVVVWATNGEMETWETAEYTTDGLPNVLITKGDYYYTGWFCEEGKDYSVDPGLELYQNPNIDNTYVITHWGYNVDFTFTVDPETNIINWDYFYSGYSTGGIGLYVFNSKDIWSEETLAEHPEYAEDSYLDKETGIYHFHVAYYATGGYGVQTLSWETFNPVEGQEPTSAVFSKLINKTISLDSFSKEGVKEIQFNKLELKSLPHEPKSVRVDVSYDNVRMDKVTKGGSSTSIITSSTPYSKLAR